MFKTSSQIIILALSKRPPLSRLLTVCLSPTSHSSLWYSHLWNAESCLREQRSQALVISPEHHLKLSQHAHIRHGLVSAWILLCNEIKCEKRVCMQISVKIRGLVGCLTENRKYSQHGVKCLIIISLKQLRGTVLEDELLTWKHVFCVMMDYEENK